MSSDTTISSTKRFGTFLGVYLPSLLTIFGVIMFLRLGWIVGMGGIVGTIIIISIGSLVTFLTALSISSITTNMKVGGGGAYFMLSRTFGLEIGGATCIPLYLCQALSVSFYIAGFAESMNYLLPQFSMLTIEFTILILLVALTCFSTKLALSSQFVILASLILALISLFLGGKNGHTTETPIPVSYPFWALFALFFPAVTGIESGLSMSGELKNPKISLPFGTIGAVITGFVVYLSISIYLAIHVPRSTLIEVPTIMQEIALNEHLILIGIWGATLSSALASLLAAPRTLKALADDALVPKWIGMHFGKSEIPHAAMLFSIVIISCGLMLGGVNHIAPILTMFYLISYAMLNLATALEDLFENPSWRPTFHIPWWISLAGCALCVFIMLMINAGMTLLALLSVLAIYALIKKRAISSNWDDIRNSVLLFLSRFAIYRLAKAHPSPKCWRPHLLVFLGDPFLRSHLIQFTQAITHEKGFLIMASILEKGSMQKSQYREKLESFFAQKEISALLEVQESKTIFDGMITMIKTYGFGSLSPNTIVLGATHDENKFPIFAEVIHQAFEMKKNVVIIRENHTSKPKKTHPKHIDVWWGGINRNNSELILVLAYMLQTSESWKSSSLALKTIVMDPNHYKPMLQTLYDVSNKARLHIQPEVVIANKDEPVFEKTIKTYSQNADLIFLGLRPPEPSEDPLSYASYYKSLLKKTENFPPIAFVLASEDLDFKKILV